MRTPRGDEHSHAVPSPDRLWVLLISAFDLGHQPFGLASPAAWLAAEGAQVACLDLAAPSSSIACGNWQP